MLNIAICGDNQIHRDFAARLVGEMLSVYGCTIDGFDSAEALLKALQYGDYVPDIALLDIELREMDGISLAKAMNDLAPSCRIIFLSAYLGYAPEVYSTQHIYFVLKDKAEEYLPDAIEKALRSLETERSTALGMIVKASGSTQIVPVADIKYMERYARRTRIVRTNGEAVTTQTPAELINAECARLFVRCHQNFWANLSFVKGIRNNEFELISGDVLPLGRVYRQAAKEAFFSYLKRTV